MSKKYMFATDKNGRSTEVKVDPAHVSRQARDLRASGYDVTVMDEDERIEMGQVAQWLRDRNANK